MGVAGCMITRYNTCMNIPHGPILVVEDMPQIRGLLEVTLRFEGYPVESASNGQEALQKIEELQPSLIITDIFMPEKEGLETIRELKQEFPTLKIIAISGGGFRSHYAITSGAENALAAAQAFGAERTLFKPFEIQHLLTFVEELLKEV